MASTTSIVSAMSNIQTGATATSRPAIAATFCFHRLQSPEAMHMFAKSVLYHFVTILVLFKAVVGP
eukprot:5163315-Pyramimonas_sp.AAC.1